MKVHNPILPSRTTPRHDAPRRRLRVRWGVAVAYTAAVAAALIVAVLAFRDIGARISQPDGRTVAPIELSQPAMPEPRRIHLELEDPGPTADTEPEAADNATDGQPGLGTSGVEQHVVIRGQDAPRPAPAEPGPDEEQPAEQPAEPGPTPDGEEQLCHLPGFC